MFVTFYFINIYVYQLPFISVEQHSPHLYFQTFHFKKVSQHSVSMTVTLVNSPISVATLIDDIVNLPSNPPALYLDLEGVNLSRQGSISILQLMLYPQNKVHLIDIHVLKAAAFTTPGSGGQTLKSILESPIVPKVFFDVRNDSDALFAHYGIALQGVQDVQLMECASRAGAGKPNGYLNGLQKCIQYDAPITPQQKQRWTAVKDAGKALYDPEKGGSFAVFNVRPLDEKIEAYCVQDVQFLPLLRQRYCSLLQPIWKTKVDAATTARVRSSQESGYQPQGEHKKYSPWVDDFVSSILGY